MTDRHHALQGTWLAVCLQIDAACIAQDLACVAVLAPQWCICCMAITTGCAFLAGSCTWFLHVLTAYTSDGLPCTPSQLAS